MTVIFITAVRHGFSVIENRWRQPCRDAKSCVSRARMRNQSRLLYTCRCCDFYSGDARARYQLRRLYTCRCWVYCSGDARFCVSTGLRHHYYIWKTPSYINHGVTPDVPYGRCQLVRGGVPQPLPRVCFSPHTPCDGRATPSPLRLPHIRSRRQPSLRDRSLCTP